MIDSGQELIAAPDDGSAIESVLRKAVSAEELAAGELDGSRFDRARLANDLARVFDELLETSSRAALHPAARCLE